MPDAHGFIFIRDLRVDALIGFYRREHLGAADHPIDLEIGIASARCSRATRSATPSITSEGHHCRIRDARRSRHSPCSRRSPSAWRAWMLLEEFDAPWVKVSIAKLGILGDAALVGVSVERGKP